jgi:hypothetical protein
MYRDHALPGRRPVSFALGIAAAFRYFLAALAKSLDTELERS